MADYQYHVFISYARGADVETWVRRFFEPQLRKKLNEKLGFEPSLFYDKAEIRTGAIWERKLVQAMRRSMCLVPVWSSTYFQSKWCVSEWASFRERSKHRALGGDTIVVPVRFSHDQSVFPPAATAVQTTNLSKYGLTAAAFEKKEDFVEFEQKVIGFVQRELEPALKRALSLPNNWAVVVPPNATDAQKEPNVITLDGLRDLAQMYVEETEIPRLYLAS